MLPTTSWCHEIFVYFSSSEIKFASWTVIHPMPHNGEYNCPCEWADGPVPPSGDPEHKELVYTSFLGPHPRTKYLIKWYRGRRGYLWWDMVETNAGLGSRRSSKLYGSSHITDWNMIKMALWHFVPFDYGMTLLGIVSVSRNWQIMPTHRLTLKTFPM